MIAAKGKAGVATNLTPEAKHPSCVLRVENLKNSGEGENHNNQNFPLEKSGVLCDLFGSASPAEDILSTASLKLSLWVKG